MNILNQTLELAHTPVYIYLSAWTLAILMLSKWIHPYINVVLLATVVCTISIYLVQVWPQRIIAFKEGEPYELRGVPLTLLHLVSHLIPMTAVILIYRKNTATLSLQATSTAIALLIVYSCLFHPHHVYGIPETMCAWLTLFAIIAYTLVVY